MKRTISWGMALVLSLSPLLLRAQAPLRTYATQRVQARLVREHADMADKRAAQERLGEDFRLLKAVRKVTIPVVFHILYTPGQAYPDEGQVHAQLAALNHNFGREEKRARHPADTLEGFLKAVALWTEQRHRGDQGYGKRERHSDG